MDAMLRFWFSILFWAFLTLTSMALFPVAALIWAVTAPFDRRKVVLHQFTCFWASLYTWFNPAWRVKIEGRENLPRRRACVMVANHLSLLDILVLFRLFTHFKWVSKIENFRVPFIGWNMLLNGYIKLWRGERQSVIQMMRAATETLAAGNSLMIFPEGTRSPTGRMRSFRSGAFEIAQSSRVPIVPIVIQGSNDALPKAGFVLRGCHDIHVEVLEPVEFERFEDLSVEDTTQMIREIIAERLGEKALTEVEAAAAASS